MISAAGRERGRKREFYLEYSIPFPLSASASSSSSSSSSMGGGGKEGRKALLASFLAVVLVTFSPQHQGAVQHVLLHTAINCRQEMHTLKDPTPNFAKLRDKKKKLRAFL